jgi:transcription-repair coupling factor (superfamily II helicase)
MYQRILDEAIEELKEEKFKNLFKYEKEKFIVKDCQLDTDLEILIPDDYVSNVEERINLYQQLNKIDNYEELNTFKNKLIDRFGKTPKKLEILFSAIILKWMGKEIGFEKIILKNHMMRAYFTSNKNSRYFESIQFKKILTFLKNNPKSCELKEVKNKLVLKKDNLVKINYVINFLNEIKSQSV